MDANALTAIGAQKGSSDPYAICLLLGREQKTRVIEQTLDPDWLETLSYENLVLREVLGARLIVRLFDEDQGRARELFDNEDDLLGELVVRRPPMTASSRAFSTYFHYIL